MNASKEEEEEGGRRESRANTIHDSRVQDRHVIALDNLCSLSLSPRASAITSVLNQKGRK